LKSYRQNDLQIYQTKSPEVTIGGGLVFALSTKNSIDAVGIEDSIAQILLLMVHRAGDTSISSCLDVISIEPEITLKRVEVMLERVMPCLGPGAWVVQFVSQFTT